MKTISLFGSIILMFCSFHVSKETSILELQKSESVIVVTAGNEESTHYLRPLTSVITNNTTDKLYFEIPAGLHFQSVDDGIQDIITTQSQMLALAPGESKNISHQGLCIQQLNNSPNSKAQFILKGMAEVKMVTLAQFLNQKNLQNSQAQQAMWVLSNNNDSYSIIGYDSKDEWDLLQTTLKLAGQDPISGDKYRSLKKSLNNPVYYSRLKGSFTMKFTSRKKVQIAIFNEQNVLIKEILNEWVDPGSKKIDYKLNAEELRGQTIVTQLIADQKVWSRREIKIPS